MLSFLFFLLAVAAAGAGFAMLPPGIQQMGAYAIAVLFLVLAAFGMTRQTKRPWRTR